MFVRGGLAPGWCCVLKVMSDEQRRLFGLEALAGESERRAFSVMMRGMVVNGRERRRSRDSRNVNPRPAAPCERQHTASGSARTLRLLQQPQVHRPSEGPYHHVGSGRGGRGADSRSRSPWAMSHLARAVHRMARRAGRPVPALLRRRLRRHRDASGARGVARALCVSVLRRMRG